MWKIWKPISTDSVAIRSLFARDTLPGWKIAMSLRLRRRRRACISTAAQLRNLYLNLDEIADWDVNTGSFHIDTEHLSGSRYHRCLLQKNECRRVFWTPLKDDASLSVELKQAVKIEVGE